MVDVFNDTDHGMGRWGRSTSIWNELRRPGSVGRCVILPTASRGIFGGTILAFGRDLGKTMALAMLVGNANRLSLSLFSPADTLAVLLANSFPGSWPPRNPRSHIESLIGLHFGAREAEAACLVEDLERGGLAISRRC